MEKLPNLLARGHIAAVKRLPLWNLNIGGSGDRHQAERRAPHLKQMRVPLARINRGCLRGAARMKALIAGVMIKRSPHGVGELMELTDRLELLHADRLRRWLNWQV